MKNFILQISNANKKVILFSLLFIFFFIVRIIAVSIFGNYNEKEMKLEDSWGYSEFAVQINQSMNWFTLEKEFPGDHREPVYSFFVAVIYFLFGLKNYFAVYVFQAALSTLMLYYIYKISLLAFDSVTIALFALVWSGCYFVYIHYSGQLLRETLIYFLIVLLFYKFLNYAKTKNFSLKGLLVLSLLYTLLIHTDGRYIFFGPFLFIIFISFNDSFYSAVKKYLLFVIMVIVFTIPWTIRNYIAYGDVIVISKLTLNLTGKHFSARGEHFNFSDIDSTYNTPAFNCNKNYPTEKERKLIKAGINPDNRTAQEIDLIKNDVYPVKSYLGRKLYFIECMWVPFDFSYNYKPFPWANFETPYSLKHNILSIISYGVLIPFFILGTIIMIKRKNKYWIVILLPVALQFVLHVLTFGLERYRHPIDAFIIITGTFGIYSVLQFSKAKFSKTSAA